MRLPVQARVEPASSNGNPLFCLPGPEGRVREYERFETVLAVRTRLVSRLDGANESVELVAIGGLIALEKEVERLVAGEAVRAGEFNRRLAHVRGDDHPLYAMRLEPLVIAIGRAPGVGDLHDLAGRRLHDDDGGVNVASLSDLPVDQRRTHGAHRNWLLAENESREVEVMDHHVSEEAARAGDIGKGRRRRIARGDRDDLECADRPLGDPLAQGGEIGVEASIEADHQSSARLSDDVETGAHAANVEVDRLLAEDRFPGASSALDEIGVGVGRRADGDRVDVPGGQDRLDVGDLSAGRFGQSGRRRRVGVRDVGDLAVAARRDIAAMDLADPTCAYDTESHVLLLEAPAGPSRPSKKNIRSILTWEWNFCFIPRGGAERRATTPRPSGAQAFRRKCPWLPNPSPRLLRRRARPIEDRPILAARSRS